MVRQNSRRVCIVSQEQINSGELAVGIQTRFKSDMSMLIGLNSLDKAISDLDKEKANSINWLNLVENANKSRLPTNCIVCGEKLTSGEDVLTVGISHMEMISPWLHTECQSEFKYYIEEIRDANIPEDYSTEISANLI